MDTAQLAGWNTPTGSDGNGTREPDGKRAIGCNSQANLAGWPTPIRENADQSASNRDRVEGKNLPETAALAGWATPVATEIRNTLENYRAMKANMTSGPRTAISHPSIQAQLVVTGPDATGSLVPTESRGQLNPALPCWLQGFPDAWLWCAPSDKPKKRTGTTEQSPSAGSATPSTSTKRQRSSKPRSTRSRKRKRDD